MRYCCAHEDGDAAVRILLETTSLDFNRSCIDNGVDRLADKDYRMPLIHFAIEHDDIKLVTTLLELNKQSSEAEFQEGTPNKKSAPNKRLDVNINCISEVTATPLLQVVQKDNWPKSQQLVIIKLLLQQNNIDVRKDDNNITPLLAACESGNLEIVQLLLEHDSSLINHFDSKINPALYLACIINQYNVIRYLLHNTDCVIDAVIVNYSGKLGNTALHLVINNNSNAGLTALHLAVTHGDVTELKKLLSLCDSNELNMQDNNGNTPLHIACCFGDKNIIDELLNWELWLDFSIKNNDGYTAYDVACVRGCNEIAYSVYTEYSDTICLKHFPFMCELLHTDLHVYFYGTDYRPSRSLRKQPCENDDAYASD